MSRNGNQKKDSMELIGKESVNTERMTRAELFQDLVFSLARRSTCKRAQVGAILVRKNRVIGTGYNGVPRGVSHCLDIGCFTRSGHRCRSTIHAEVNAILSAGVSGYGEGPLELWCTLRPCLDCIKMAIAVGVNRIYYFTQREDEDAAAYEDHLDRFGSTKLIDIVWVNIDRRKNGN